jgi:hypothetical protein
MIASRDRVHVILSISVRLIARDATFRVVTSCASSTPRRVQLGIDDTAALVRRML